MLDFCTYLTYWYINIPRLIALCGWNLSESFKWGATLRRWALQGVIKKPELCLRKEFVRRLCLFWVVGVMLDFADMFALSGTLLLTLDTVLSVQVLTRYNILIRYLSRILSCHEGTWWSMTRKASFLIAALIPVVILILPTSSLFILCIY